MNEENKQPLAAFDIHFFIRLGYINKASWIHHWRSPTTMETEPTDSNRTAIELNKTKLNIALKGKQQFRMNEIDVVYHL